MESKRLIKPLEAYILVPDRLCNAATTEATPCTPCLADLIIKTFEQNSPSATDTQFVPVNWLNIRLDPQIVVGVVAAVLPILDFKTNACRFRRKHVLGHKKRVWSSSSLIETLECVQFWDWKRMVNLQAVLIVPWPDPPAEVFHRAQQNLPSPQKVRATSMSSRKYVTLGSSFSCFQKYFINMDELNNAECQVIFMEDWFTHSSAELAVALLACLSRGVLKDCNSVYQQWLKFLVKPNNEISGTEISVTNCVQSAFCRRMMPSLCHTVENRSGKDPRATYRRSFSTRVHKKSRKLWALSNQNNAKQLMNAETPAVQTPIRQMCHSRIGLIGLQSELPSKIAHILHHGLRMEVAYYQRHPIPNVPYIYFDDMKNLVVNSDIVILADDTVNEIPSKIIRAAQTNQLTFKHAIRPRIWLDQKQFTHFRPHALLVCVTKIQCIDFPALSLALRYGQLSGAGITMPTVWFTQLSDLDCLRLLPNTFILPPATSSACAPTEVRQHLALKIVRLLTNALLEPLKSQHQRHGEHHTFIKEAEPIVTIPAPMSHDILTQQNCSNTHRSFIKMVDRGRKMCEQTVLGLIRRYLKKRNNEMHTSNMCSF
ncbi:hypothetical protein EG68_01667 [Paragonimus skrjabini miyazakii]|uniref:Uncharacterized protein n=1 Tax=Paragonimus skrjabini miyazakii TaxID=59628 RepID=A0A8S9Z0E1_9TREM|nr:hypothetical protein EG68_01667 [Paragonimus skrjabini miyazakii]